MSHFTTLLQKTSSLKGICILFVLSHFVLLLMMVFTFPEINEQIGTKAFDLQPFGYSVSTAESIVANLDEPTTQLYLFPQLTLLDLFYPVLLALFLSSLLYRLIKAESKMKSVLLVIPFLAMSFDYLENVCIILMITKSVAVSETVVFLSSSFTVLKSMLTSVVWVIVLGYLGRGLFLRVWRKKKTQLFRQAN